MKAHMHKEKLYIFSAKHADSAFHAVVSGMDNSSVLYHSQETLAEIARMLKPGGTACIREAVSEDQVSATLRTAEKLKSVLRLSGFVDILEVWPDFPIMYTKINKIIAIKN